MVISHPCARPIRARLRVGGRLLSIAACAVLASLLLVAPADAGLPLGTVFKGQATFQRLVARAEKEDWRALPIGERTTRVGLALTGTPYEGYTLEIDNRIEAPSANLDGLDCWTFYEISLGFARMLRAKPAPYEPADLLRMIELERYRNGRCTGEYLSRIHFLEELFYDNERRGLLTNITRQLPGAERMDHRDIREMTVMWRHYRYLRSNPALLPEMARIEERVSDLPVYHVPKAAVPGVEKYLRDGDIIAITSRDTGGYTSHVGLAYRDQNGTLRFLHASSRYRQVILDTRLSAYLADKHDDAGIVVARPNDVADGTLAAR
jgi:hypothetical protein